MLIFHKNANNFKYLAGFMFCSYGLGLFFPRWFLFNL